MAMKFELFNKTKIHFKIFFRRILALRDIPAIGIKAGDVGGLVDAEDRLSQDGNAWVYGNAQVYGNARVYGDAQVHGNARVHGDAQVHGDAWVHGDAHWLLIGPIGSRMSMMTVTADARIGLRVTTGCFSGSLAEFEAAIAATHGDNEHAIHYRAAIALIRARFPEQAKAVAA
jgi:hypothetical protein